MKKIFYIILFLIPFVALAQSTDKSSPLLNGWQNVGNTHFSAGEAIYTSLDISPSGQPYVGYMDEGNSGKATVMKFDGTNWTNVGNAGFSAGGAQWISLVFNPIDGQPYVAFRDDAHSGKATVMKFDETSWVNLGIAGFSAGSTSWESLAFSPSGQPYVAYTDDTHSGKTTVMKFDGTNWVNVGIAGFSVSGAACESLAFSPSGQPYVAYSDGAAIPWNSTTVMKFDGSNWINVGNTGFSAGFTWGECLTFSPSGEPHVSYIDLVDSSKVSVMKYNGTSWVYVGVRGFSKSGGYIHSEGLAFNPVNSQPYVAFEDTSSSYKATAMTFNGTDWVNVGNAGFSSGFTQCVSLDFTLSGQPYVAYGDGYMGKASVMKYDTTCNTLPIPTITGLGNLCVNSGYYYYSTETGMNNYQWSISPGGTIITGQGTSVAQVIWNQAGNQWIAVTYTNSFGCTALNPTIYPVTVDPLPDSAGTINGSSIVCAGSNEIIYSVESVVNAITYVWTLPAGAAITSGSGTNAIIVNFAENASSGNITVYGNNLCGNGTTSPPFYVTVNPIPETPTITVNGDTLFSSAPIGNQWFYNGILLVNDTNQIYNVSPYLPGYYWTQVTLNECVSDTSNHIYYNSVGVNEKIELKLILYPNPVTDILTIEFIGDNNYLKFIEIYELRGKMIFEFQTSESKINISTKNFPEGIYFINLKTGDLNFVGKFIKFNAR
jgi:hypothetical protein